MLPKVDRNTEIVLDRDTKQQMIILQREPISQPNRRTPTPKQAPRMIFFLSFFLPFLFNIYRQAVIYYQRFFDGMVRSTISCLFLSRIYILQCHICFC